MYTLTLHKTLTLEKWKNFKFDKQIVMVANEIQRYINISGMETSREAAQNCLERAFELLDLTIAYQNGNARKELLRLRDIFAEEYTQKNTPENPEKKNRKIFLRVLLSLHPKTFFLTENV